MCRKEPDLPPNFNVSGGNAQDKRFAAAWLHKPEEHLDRSAFTGTVWAKEAKDFPAAHGQRKVADRHLVLEDLAQILRFNCEIIGMIQWPLQAVREALLE